MKSLFSCTLVAALLIAGGAQAASIAISDVDTFGNQVWTYGLGADFDVVNPAGVDVTALGYFDHQLDGIVSTTTIHVSIYDRTAGGTELMRLAFDATDSGALEPGTSNRFKDLAAPLLLGPGQYSVVAIGFDSANHNANVVHRDLSPTTDDGGGLLDLSVMNSRWGGALGTLPGSTGYYAPTYAFGAATFKFEAASTRGVPEPGSLALLGLGILGLGILRIRRSS